MKVLVTGNKGYIGSVLTDLLTGKGYGVTGLDSNYYQGCEYETLRTSIRQIHKDIREVDSEDLEGFNAVIHLAALSNDPIGELKPNPTLGINYQASVRLARLAKKSGVSRFIFASSQGMYGAVRGYTVDEDFPKSPLTAYAKSKLLAEEGIGRLADRTFTPVYLRSTTVCGISPMLRCDILLNTMVSDAVCDGVVKLNSKKPIWRSIIHVEDIAQAYLAALSAPKELVANEAFNVGENANNHTILEFARKVRSIIPHTKIIQTDNAGPDARTYKVDFGKIAYKLKKYFKPKWKLEDAVEELYESFKIKKITRAEIEDKYIRLNRLKMLFEEARLDDHFFWKKDPRWFP